MTDEETAQLEEQENNNETATKESHEEEYDKKKTPQDYIKERQEKKKQALEERVAQLEAEREELKKAEEKKRVSETIEKYPFLAEKKEELQDYAKNEAYKNVPLDKLALMVADPEEFIQFGAKQAEQSAKLAGRNVFGGATPAKVKEKDITDLDDNEFAELVYQNRGRRY